MKKFAIALASATVMCAASHAAHTPAHNFPSEPVRMIVPFPPGGGSDIVARVISTTLTAKWKQSVIVENKGGAGGNVGSGYVAHAKPDGYTLILGNTATHAVNPSLYKHLSFDLVKDFIPVAYISTGPHVLAVSPNLNIHSVADLVQLAQAEPGKLNYASFGSGSTAHLAGEIFKKAAHISWTHVPYRGTGPAVVDLMGGQVQAMFVPIAAAMPLLQSGKLQALAVTSLQRSPFLPKIPTMAEQGYPGFQADLWYGLFAPAETPPPVVAKIAADTLAALKNKDAQDALAAQGMEVTAQGPDQFHPFVTAEIEKWATAVHDSGAKVD
ncbi:Bug family tripartite tricarboxylate transporter substrate binding protein [Bordetella tumulicola]|uniref:Bug family tripartite tricarboxylate transporter substrate binding protein n=1 Tax=Bordetella tumulicola TaxID=1649133 RepID=UPI0039F0D517